MILDFRSKLSKYIEDGMLSTQFLYWNNFLMDIYPILRDLTRSHREGNWDLHLSAIWRALLLFFVFDRTNYCQWVPLYYEDCLKLQNEFPALLSFIQKWSICGKTYTSARKCCAYRSGVRTNNHIIYRLRLQEESLG